MFNNLIAFTVILISDNFSMLNYEVHFGLRLCILPQLTVFYEQNIFLTVLPQIAYKLNMTH